LKSVAQLLLPDCFADLAGGFIDTSLSMPGRWKRAASD